MSYTEARRLAALQAEIRACTVNNAIAALQCRSANCGPNTQINRPVGNSESGRLAQLQADLACCGPAGGGVPIICCDKPQRVPQTRTIQTEGAYTASRVASCTLAATTPNISAGGISESRRLRKLQDDILNVDYGTDPDARFLQYQRVFPAPCPPAPVANNQPYPQPQFPCAPNQFPFS